MSTTEAATTTNALSILLAAVPSSVFSSIESEYSSFTKNFAPATTSQPSETTSQSPTGAIASHVLSTDSSGSDTLSSTQQSLTNMLSSTQSSFTNIILSTQSSASDTPSLTPSSSSPSTFSTSTTSNSASSNTNSGASATSSTPSTIAPAVANSSHNDSNQPGQGAIAGIATGVAAGIVIFALLITWLLRRRKQQKSPFHKGFLSRKSSSRGAGPGSSPKDTAYPQAAWLYDPVMTPAGAHTPAGGQRGAPPMREMPRHQRTRSTEHLAPDAVAAAAAARSSHSRSPGMRDRDAEAPEVLTPAMSMERERNPFLSPYDNYSNPQLHQMHPTSPMMSPDLPGRNSSPSNVSMDSARSSGEHRYSGGESPSPVGNRAAARTSVGQRPMTAIWEEPGIAR